MQVRFAEIVSFPVWERGGARAPEGPVRPPDNRGGRADDSMEPSKRASTAVFHAFSANQELPSSESHSPLNNSRKKNEDIKDESLCGNSRTICRTSLFPKRRQPVIQHSEHQSYCLPRGQGARPVTSMGKEPEKPLLRENTGR
ncbi:unnamed protein product [Pleuronectes platessa]|uniref:Uncharacterized protein n=1 Tax=Pleuronectes platessa TaxID=8262 RepID=A0A9N7ZC59_PLEPL|nr:unnamed protein product [Pleuronectes platessa]